VATNPFEDAPDNVAPIANGWDVKQIDEATSRLDRPAWPNPLGEAAYHGVTGDFVRLIEPNTEADPAALLFQFLCYAGNAFGTKAWYLIEETRHYPNLFVCVVGRTAVARKGTSRKHVTRVMGEAAPEWESECTASGLSTGEGLIARVRDPLYGIDKEGHPELIHPGAKDKRLLVIEEEFSRPLRVMERNNNTLSAVLRQAWDGERLSILTREDPIKATGAMISIVAHTTIEELRAELTEVSTANGFGNRFLWPLARRSKALALGGSVDPATSSHIAETVRRAIQNCPFGGLILDEVAQHKWIDVYGSIEDEPGLYGAITARTAPQILRVALIYALLDQQSQIGIHQLAAAKEVVRYSNDSVRHIFGDRTGHRIADTIMNALHSNPSGLSRTFISHVLFSRNVAADRIASAIAELIDIGKARATTIKQTGGRPAEVIVAA